MSTDKETSTDTKPKKKWLRRRQKMSGCESRAAPQEVEEHRDSRAGPGAQAAAAESRAAAPHGPRARGRALLRSLRHGSRAVLSRVAAVIRPRSQQPGTQRQLDEGMEAVRAARACAAGTQSRAASPHGPCCPRTPPPTPLGALGGQGAGAALGSVPKTRDGEEKDWEVSGPKELSQGAQDPEQRCRSEVRPPVRPGEAGVEHSNAPPCTASGQASALPRTASHSGAEESSFEALLGLLPPSPLPSQVEARRQWAIAAAKILLSGLPSEEGDSSEDVLGSSSSSSSGGDERVSVSCEDEPKPLGPCKGTGHSELAPQTRVRAAAKGEATKRRALSEEKSSAITIHTIWVNTRYPQLLGHPDMPLEEGADGDLPSRPCALAAAAALAGAPEDEEHPVSAAALPGRGAQAAAAESRAAAPHGPRARGRALLRSLRHGSRAVLSRVAAVIRPRSQQPGTQKHRHEGMEAVRAPRAPAEGAQSRAASPHGPCCPPTPPPSPLGALGGQGAGAALEADLPLPAREWKVCFLLEPDWEGDTAEKDVPR